MRRAYLLAAISIMTLSATLWFYHQPSPAQSDKQKPNDTPSERTTQLPIGQVVLFSSGVGYFQREGSVEGNARIDLSFPVSDINDLLKSMVLRDLNGGHISTVSYDSNAPVERTLKSFAINLTGNPTFGTILNQVRGEKVEVVLQQTNATQQAPCRVSSLASKSKRSRSPRKRSRLRCLTCCVPMACVP